MYNKLTIALIYLVFLSLIAGAMLFMLFCLIGLVFVYMYHALEMDAKRLAKNKMLNEILKKTGRLN